MSGMSPEGALGPEASHVSLLRPSHHEVNTLFPSYKSHHAATGPKQQDKETMGQNL